MTVGKNNYKALREKGLEVLNVNIQVDNVNVWAVPHIPLSWDCVAYECYVSRPNLGEDGVLEEYLLSIPSLQAWNPVLFLLELTACLYIAVFI